MGSCAVRQKPKDESLPLASSRFLQVAEDRWSPAFTETPEIFSYFVEGLLAFLSVRPSKERCVCFLILHYNIDFCC